MGRISLTNGRDHRDENPRWSPDSKRIAFKSNRVGSTTYDIYVMDADGRNAVRIEIAIGSEKETKNQILKAWSEAP
jgi:Tol biopolymer transport system component